MKTELSVVTSIQKLQTSALHLRLRELVKDERRIGVEILEALREVEFRRAHCELGYSSLFSYCVKELGYSESQAYRRVEAMRALKEVPELKEKIESGALTITTVSMVQSAAKKSRVSKEEKKALFQKMEHKPAAVVELELKPQDAPRMHWLEVNDEAKELLNRVKEFSAARFRDLNPSSSELIVLLAREWLSKNDPLVLAEKGSTEREAVKKIEKRVSASALPENAVPEKNHAEENPNPPRVRDQLSAAPAKIGKPSLSTSSRKNSCVKNSRYIPAAVNRTIWLRDRGQCTFVSPTTGRRCDSRYALQRDHIELFSRGGSSRDAGNLRLYCPAHNRARVPRVDRSSTPRKGP